jgi:hypothetical protein
MIADLYAKVYNRKYYNCFTFAADAWLQITGDPIFIGVLAQDDCLRTLFSAFYQLDKPSDPCVIIYGKGATLHIGIYTGGRVLHITEAGVVWQPLDTFGSEKVRCYARKHNSCL